MLFLDHFHEIISVLYTSRLQIHCELKFICLLFVATHKEKPEKQEKIEKKEPLKGMYSASDILCLFNQ